MFHHHFKWLAPSASHAAAAEQGSRLHDFNRSSEFPQYLVASLYEFILFAGGRFADGVSTVEALWHPSHGRVRAPVHVFIGGLSQTAFFADWIPSKTP
jgi:hypothetical protein